MATRVLKPSPTSWSLIAPIVVPGPLAPRIAPKSPAAARNSGIKKAPAALVWAPSALPSSVVVVSSLVLAQGTIPRRFRKTFVSSHYARPWPAAFARAVSLTFNHSALLMGRQKASSARSMLWQTGRRSSSSGPLMRQPSAPLATSRTCNWFPRTKWIPNTSWPTTRCSLLLKQSKPSPGGLPEHERSLLSDQNHPSQWEGYPP